MARAQGLEGDAHTGRRVIARESLRVVHAERTADEAFGVKHDAEKPRLDLLPWSAVLACADVLTFGATKYGDENWRRVPGGERRFLAASLRHVIAYARGEWLDPESGLPHLAHALSSLMFVFELASKEGVK
jgi:hypothetical protein